MVKAEIFRAKDLKLTDSKGGGSSKASPIGSGSAKSLKLGQHLHVVLVTAYPNGLSTGKATDRIGLFPTEELLAYDLEIIDDDRKKGIRLGDLGLLSGKHSIIYAQSKVPLPSLFLKREGTNMNILHGSCRKLHGKGEDCLVAADELISSTFADLRNRPSALFLTGDQIYADDVADPLISHVTQLGIELLGWEERIADIGKQLTEILVGERQGLVEKYAGFTSPNASNHLLSFGEFAAMYLLAWNVENWPDRFANMATIPADNRRKYNEHVRRLEKTRNDLPAVRRLLANIPTYMIFDDHEITDDWNITREWHEKVKTSKCGKQVVSNGLAAYWAFQGWGNQPASFGEDFINKITEYLGKNGNQSESERTAFADHLWNFHDWTFAAPTNPLTIVTDCRTQRHYDSYDGPPQLLSSEGLHSVLRASNKENYKRGDPIIIVSPTPVFGFLLLEALQKAAAKMAGVYKLDLETWHANQGGLVNLLSFLIKELGSRHCIFLSGDVHYGFTISAVFALMQKSNNAEQCVSVTQLNSSATKTTSLVKMAFVSEIMGHIRQLFPLKQIVRVGWINGNTYRILSESIRVKGKPTMHLYIRQRKHDKPMGQQPPEWIEARSIVKASGSIIPPLIISDNNIGLVTLDSNRIVHRLLVRKEGKKNVKVHQSVVEMDHGRSKLEDLVKAKMEEIYQRHFDKDIQSTTDSSLAS
jgi:hypothetical protein